MEKNKLVWWAKALCICTILLLYTGNVLEAQASHWILVWDKENNCVKIVEVDDYDWEGPLLPFELLDEVGWNGILSFPASYGEYSEKYPIEAQLQAAKGVGSIRWSTKTGGPEDISGNLTPPSKEDPEVIAWRFLEEKKLLYGINDPREDLRISVRIDDKYATTIHFDQIYKGVVVDNGYLGVSIFPNGVIHSVNGVYYPDINVETEPQVSAQEAVTIAKQHWEKYSIHDSVDEYIVQNMTSASVAELTIMLTARRHYLLWCFEILHWNFYIDAHSGVIRESYPDSVYLGRSLPSMPGGNIEVTPEHIDFTQEQIDSPGDYPKQEVVISNTVGSILVIRDIVLQGESFRIEEPSLSLPLPIPAGGNAVVSIGFSPSATGKVTGILSIESTDKDSPVVEVLLEGGEGGEASMDSENSKEMSFFPYSLSPYGSWISPFFLYNPSAVNINPCPLFLSQDYLFPWNYFNNLPGNMPASFSFNFLYPTSNNLFDYSFYPTLEYYNYLVYDLFRK